MSRTTSIPAGLCQCGCGGRTSIAPETRLAIGHVKGQPFRFIRGHAVKGRRLPARNGGLVKPDGTGRWRIMARDGSTPYFYRAVMEAQVRRPLRDDEEVHHVNEDSTDDRPENLELLTLAEHRARHRPTHCKRGHPFDAVNTYVNPQGHHQCRQCKRDRDAARRALTLV